MKKLFQIVFACTLMLIAATALAAKQEKVLICHVGNETGLGGEVYLDDPTCTPSDANGYFCPDAGKIDLIVVAKVSKHLNNPNHEWDGISDYEPSDVSASGDGKEDSDFNGVDDGCELPEVCPCVGAGIPEWDVAAQGTAGWDISGFNCGCGPDTWCAWESDPYTWVLAIENEAGNECGGVDPSYRYWCAGDSGGSGGFTSAIEITEEQHLACVEAILDYSNQ